MKKLLRIILILAVAGIVSASGVYMYVFHKPHRNIAKEAAAYMVEAPAFYAEFADDETTAYEKYGNLVIQVSGSVADISLSEDAASIILVDEFEGISCAFDSVGVAGQKDLLASIAPGSTISLKGQCDGYDMIMGVVLTRCVLMK